MTRFRRLVLELGRGAADPATMRQAAAFARLLDAELHALFVEDEILLHASALPFAREISPLSLRWRTLEPERLNAGLRAAADRARRHFTEAARETGVTHNFEVRRGDVALHVTEICVASDIFVVSPPRRETTHGSHRPRETAHRSVASMLLLPDRTVTDRGVVVAVVFGASDPALDVARGIAARERVGLMIVAPDGSGVRDEAGVRVLPGNSAQDLAAVLGDTRERLIVMTRGNDFADPIDVLAARGVAVLVIEPI